MASEFDVTKYYKIRAIQAGKTREKLIKRGTEAPKLVSMGARWSVTNRPRRWSFVTFQGYDPRRMDVPVLMDEFFTNGHIEDEVDFINGLRKGDDYEPPPQIFIDGGLPVNGIGWVVEDITYGDNVIYRDDGNRMRQDAVIHFLEYIKPDTLTVRPPAIGHYHDIKAGETLRSIAKTEYGDPKLWTSIKSVNNIRDPKKFTTNDGKKLKRLWIPPLVTK